MNILDDVSQIKKIDSGRVLESAELLPSQLRQAWQEIKSVSLPLDFKKVTAVVVSGMGGSALGSHIIQTGFFRQLRVPFTIVNGYELPAWVNRQTLCIISSYSGTTEETVMTIAQAQKKRAKIFGISSGGEVGQQISQGRIAGYRFTPVANPSGQPRMGLGYSLGAQLALLNQLGLLSVSDAEITAACTRLGQLPRRWGQKIKAKNNTAKKLARSLVGYIPIVVGSEFLAGNAHVFANQLNENAKTFANYFTIPELNHHLLEGLRFPQSARRRLAFILLQSNQYDKKNQARFKVTERILKQHQIVFFSFRPSATEPLSQMFQTLAFSGYVSFYLAMANRIDPSPIPWVNYFKSELKKIY